MLSNSSLYILCLTIVGLTVAVELERPQLIRFYTTTNCVASSSQPPYHNYTMDKNITSDSGSQPFVSYCVIRGVWRVELSIRMHESDFNISLGDGCATCYKAKQGSKYGIIRPVGGRELSKPSLSLYSDRYFGGTETILKGDYTFNNTYSFMSFAFTSFNNWTWQTYYLPHFRGNYSCVRPTPGTEVTIVDLASFNVGSIRLGCRNSSRSNQITGIAFFVGIIIAFTFPGFAAIL